MRTKNKNKTSTKCQRDFFVPLFSPLVRLVSVCLSVPRVSLSAEPPPAKTDSDLEADERAAAG